VLHVPESGRVPELSTRFDGNNGVFDLASPEPGWRLAIIAADGYAPIAAGWEHVSVHAYRGEQTRTPTWKEMCAVKDIFWDDDDLVVEFHPRRAEYVNTHPHTLHLWRHAAIPTPPQALV
jgi:hypothetical protein